MEITLKVTEEGFLVATYSSVFANLRNLELTALAGLTESTIVVPKINRERLEEWRAEFQTTDPAAHRAVMKRIAELGMRWRLGPTW